MNIHVIIMTESLKPLAKWLEKQSLPYDDEPLREIVDEIIRIVDEDELAQKSRSTVQGS